MPIELQFDTEARASIIEGVDAIAKAVGTTMGARGRQVLIEQGGGDFYPKFTLDGVSVARCIKLEDKFANLGAQALRQVATRQVDEVGDGTTASVVIAAEILRGGMKAVAAGYDAQGIKRGIDKAVDAVTAELKKLAKPVTTHEEMAQIATISAHGDTKVGEIIAKAVDAVGKDGVVSIEQNKLNDGLEVEVVDGCRVPAGYISPYFSTNESLEAHLDNPLILLTDAKFDTLPQIHGALTIALQSARPLLIISDDLSPDVQQTVLVNKLQGALKVCCVKAPGYDQTRKDLLADLAVLTGATAVTLDTGRKLEGIKLADLGQCARVVVTKDRTDIIGGKGTKTAIEKRAREIRSLIRKAETKAKKDLQERLARLTAGVAVIRVGGTTELEAKELIDRVDDALHAVKAARDEGIVPGGGAALLGIAHQHNILALTEKKPLEEGLGAKIVIEACQAPFYQIMKNAGKERAAPLFADNIVGTDQAYDVRKHDYVDAYKSGIIDPVKVVRSSLQNAASVAGLLITTECLIVDKPKEKTKE